MRRKCQSPSSERDPDQNDQNDQNEIRMPNTQGSTKVVRRFQWSPVLIRLFQVRTPSDSRYLVISPDVLWPGSFCPKTFVVCEWYSSNGQ